MNRTANAKANPILPSRLSEQAFTTLFGGIYEHSPWVAQQAWKNGIDESHDSINLLASALAACVDKANQSDQLALIVAHPDLAGKAAMSGKLTRESTSEQASAGIDQCTDQEFEKFQNYNRQYKRKFNFPFVMAVKGSNRHKILSAFEERLKHDYETEFNRALKEIHSIARFRLEEVFNQ